MSIPGGRIATIAQRDYPAVATRNVADFAACGVDLIELFSIAVQHGDDHRRPRWSLNTVGCIESTFGDLQPDDATVAI